MLAASLSTALLKARRERKRPVWQDPVTTLSSYSFPSGHATGIAAAAGVTIVLSMMFVRRRNLRRLCGLAVGVRALLVGLDRVFLGVHNVSDVLAGFAARRVRGCWSGWSSTTRRRAPSRSRTSPPRCRRRGSWRWC